ncbi:MAG: hypothetical protein M1835_003307 [Candelina submexicana]|nr:MAG: hypothetical protein M1835_003307 [Candelina submexicana]
MADRERFKAAYDGFREGHTNEETRAILQEWITTLAGQTPTVLTEENSATSSTIVDVPKLLNTSTPKSPEVSDRTVTTATSLSHTSDILPQEVEVLRPSKDWIYAQPYPLKNASLTDLYELERGLPSTSSGFLLIDVGITLATAPRHHLTRGTVQPQLFSDNRGIVVVNEHPDKPQDLSSSGQTFAVPCFPAKHIKHTQVDLEDLFASRLEQLKHSDTVHEYLNATSHSQDIRKNLGLPEIGLQPGSRLLSTVKHYAGIHSSYVYISSSSGSAFPLHREDFDLNSANIIYEGEKLWVVVAPSSTPKLETRLAKQLKISPDCTQFLRHQNILPQPSLLRQWGIKFELVLQTPGCLILVQPYTYHYGLNLGANIAEAINYSDPEWTVHPLYMECQQGAPCSDAEPMRVSGMSMGKVRPLKVDTTWEDSELLSSPKKAFLRKDQPVRTSRRLASKRAPHPMARNAWPKSIPQKKKKKKGSNVKSKMEHAPCIDDSSALSPTAASSSPSSDRGLSSPLSEPASSASSIIAFNSRPSSPVTLKDQEVQPSNSSSKSAPEAIEEIHSQMYNENISTLDLPTTEQQRVHDSDIILRDAFSEAGSEDAIVAEPEEPMQQVRDDLTTMIQELMGDAQTRLGSDRIDEGLPCHFSRIAEDDTKCLSVNAASPQFNPLEPKESDLLKATGEDRMEVQEVVATPPIVDPADLKEHVATSCATGLLGQSPTEQRGNTISSSTQHQSQCAFRASFEPPLPSVPPIHRIEWWIQFVQDNYQKLARNTSGLFMSSMPNFDDAHQTLKRFLPNQASLTGSWLNDDIVMSMIELLFSTQGNVFLIHSQEIAAAHTKSNPKLLEYDVSADLVLLPCHYENHWCLVVVDTRLRAFTVYETSKQLNIRTEFIYGCFSKLIPGLRLELQELYPGTADVWNCGVYTIARAEALLHSNVLSHNDPLELRARYIERLLQQFHLQVTSSCHVDQLYSHVSSSSRKRPFDSISEGTTESEVRKNPRALFFDMSIATNKDHRQNLETLGSDWASYYSTQVRSTGLPSAEIYQILALVSAIGSPQVLLDIADLCRSMSKQPYEMSPQVNQMFKAYWLYNNAEASILSGHVRQRLLAVFIYEQFKALDNCHQRLLDENRKIRNRKDHKGSLTGRPKDSTSYALDDLVAYCHNTTPENVQLHPNHYKAERSKIKRLKDKGKALFDFSERFQIGRVSMNVWMLLPMRKIRSAFDEDVYARPKDYLELKGKALAIFLDAVKQLRPKLESFCLQAGKHDWLFFGGQGHRGLNLKLQNMDPEVIAKETLDSQLLLTCFETS